MERDYGYILGETEFKLFGSKVGSKEEIHG